MLKQMKTNKLFFLLLIAMVALPSCYDYNQKADGPGANIVRTKEYAPAMYHSEPYEPLTQIIDTAGWLASGEWSGYTKEGYGEFYNSAPHYKKVGTNVLTPVEGTVKRVENRDYLDISLQAKNYEAGDDSRALAAVELKNPISLTYETVINEKDSTTSLELTKESKAVLNDCKQVYTRICSHCHGKGGAGDGKVAEVYGGVPVYQADAIKGLSAGHIYHVITYGKGRMGAHGSQVSPEQRWKIVTYVQHLQKQ